MKILSTEKHLNMIIKLKTIHIKNNVYRIIFNIHVFKKIVD